MEEMERKNKSELITTVHGDQHDFEAQLAQMDVEITEYKWKLFVRMHDQISTTLNDVGLKPNQAQYGIAVGAICNDKMPRSIISVPSGKGKSRIIAAIIAMRAKSGLFTQKHFTVVYSSELLQKVDFEKYVLLAIIYDVEIRQVVFEGGALDTVVDKESCVLIDEADTVLLDHAATLPNKRVYGFSATPLSKDSGTEYNFLKHHGFVTIDSKMEGYIDPHTAAMSISIPQYMA